jgi:hypothetical protein
VKRIFAIVAFFALGASPAAAQAAVAVDVADLLNDPESHEGPVAVAGELIGDYGFRGDGSMWTQLNGDSYAAAPVLDGGELTGGNIGVAVRIPGDVAETLGDPGGYRVRGPVVVVTGTWKYHDPDRGGESYVDAVDLLIVEPGHNLAEHPNYWILGLGVGLIVIALALRKSPIRRRKR